GVSAGGDGVEMVTVVFRWWCSGCYHRGSGGGVGGSVERVMATRVAVKVVCRGGGGVMG
nr:hypothetical protein [Tanacetum cinerariifolium]